MTPVMAPALRQFIYAYVPTTRMLQVLLAVHADSASVWSAGRLTAALPELGLAAAEDLLAALHWLGFLAVTQDGGLVYQPSSPELAARVDELVALHAERPTEVLQEIARLELLNGVRSFADAFRLRRTRDRG